MKQNLPAIAGTIVPAGREKAKLKYAALHTCRGTPAFKLGLHIFAYMKIVLFEESCLKF